MSSEKNFLENDVNATGFAASISFAEKDGSIKISLMRREKSGSDLETVFIENATKEQLDSVCDLLNTF